jgi:hypothetical protein
MKANERNVLVNIPIKWGRRHSQDEIFKRANKQPSPKSQIV